MGAALGKPAKAGGTLASDSRRSVSQRLERGLKQAKEELISKETWTSPRQAVSPTTDQEPLPFTDPTSL